jgi:thioredoxin 1
MGAPIHVSDDTFEKFVLQSDKPVLVDFWAPWCGPCKMIAPVVEDLAKEYEGRAVIAKVNTDDNPLWASRYGVQGIPTVIVFKGGKEASRVVGVAPKVKDTLKNKLEASL